MHQLLELIKKEQNIYNIVFHELIRQVNLIIFLSGACLLIGWQQCSCKLNVLHSQEKIRIRMWFMYDLGANMVQCNGDGPV